MDTAKFSRFSVLMFPKSSLVMTLNMDTEEISNIERPSPCAELREKHTGPGETLNLYEESIPDGIYRLLWMGAAISLKR
jgi:hypothetical protein